MIRRLCMLIVAACICSSAEAEPKWSYSGLTRFDAGGPWSSTIGFAQPQAVAVDGEGRVYAIDNRNPATIWVYASSGSLLHQWAGSWYEGFGPDASIAVSKSGRVYVANFHSGKIFVIEGGYTLQTWRLGPIQGGPIAVDENDRVYAIQFPDRVIRFSPNGEQETSWTRQAGTGSNRYFGGIAVHGGVVYVTSHGATYSRAGTHLDQVVQKYTPDGVLLGSWGSVYYFRGPNPFEERLIEPPAGIAIDSQGYVYLGDQHAVKKYTADGDYLGFYHHRESPSIRGMAPSHDGQRMYLMNASLGEVWGWDVDHPTSITRATWGTIKALYR